MAETVPCALVSGCGLMPERRRRQSAADWVIFEKPQDQFKMRRRASACRETSRDAMAKPRGVYGYTAQLHWWRSRPSSKANRNRGSSASHRCLATCTQGVSYPDGRSSRRASKDVDLRHQAGRLLVHHDSRPGRRAFETGTPLPFATTPAKGLVRGTGRLNADGPRAESIRGGSSCSGGASGPGRGGVAG